MSNIAQKSIGSKIGRLDSPLVRGQARRREQQPWE
jgi:hypothetical protein